MIDRKYLEPYQKVEFVKRHERRFRPVAWDKWSLKLSKNTPDILNVTLSSPLDWVDFESDSGLKINVGDQMALYAYVKGKSSSDIKRFGGFVTKISSDIKEGDHYIEVECADYSYALKNLQIFKDFHRILPIPMGIYSDRIHKFTSRNTLYEAIKDFCDIAFTAPLRVDYSRLENPMLFQLRGDVDLLRSLGTGTCTVDQSMGVHRPSLRFTTAGEVKNKWVIYSDPVGFDLSAHPHLLLHYYAPPHIDRYFYYFEYTINNHIVQIPWFGEDRDISLRTSRLISQMSSTFVPLKIDVYNLVLNTGLNIAFENRVTRIELCARRIGLNLPVNDFWIDNIAVADAYQVVTPKIEETYKDALTILNDLARSGGHTFRINPNMQPILYDDRSRTSGIALVEGENIIDANITISDDNLKNNIIVMGKLDEGKVIIAQAHNIDSIHDHGQYMLIEENSDLKTNAELKTYVDQRIGDSSYMIPNIRATIIPEYDLYPGMIVYVYIPSLGIERSLEIVTISHDHNLHCEIELGNPSHELIKFLTDTTVKQKIGNDRGVLLSQNVKDGTIGAGRFNKPFVRPRAKVVLSGDDLISPFINVNEDVDATGSRVWTNLLNPQFTDDLRPDGLIYKTGNFQRIVGTWYRWVIGIDTKNINNAGLQQLRIRYFDGFTNNSPGHQLRVEIFREFDIGPGFVPIWSNTIRLTGCQIQGNPNSPSRDIVVLDTDTLPPLGYYHIVISIMSPIALTWTGDAANTLGIGRIIAIYGGRNDFEE